MTKISSNSSFTDKNISIYTPQALIALAPEYDEEEAGLVTVGTSNASKPSRFTNLFKGPDNDTSAIKAVRL